MTDIINILLYQFAYHFKHGLICNSKQHYSMFKITKCENCVVCLQFALIATSRLKPGKVLKDSYIRLDKGRTRYAFSMLVEMAICLLIVYRMERPHSDKLKCRMDIN